MSNDTDRPDTTLIRGYWASVPTQPTPAQDAAADARVAALDSTMTADDAELAHVNAGPRATEPVRSQADAVKLAQNDHRVRMVLAGVPRHAETQWHEPGTTGYMVRQLRTAALTLVELYRLGYRVGWDGLKAYVQATTTPAADAFYLANPYAPDAAQVLAADMIASGLAWPER